MAGRIAEWSDAASVATGTEDLECMCAICTCGKHRCPPQQQRLPFTGSTQYRDEYKEYPVCPVHHHKIEYPQRPHIPFDATTTYKQEFVPRDLPARAPESRASPSRPHIPFEGTTTSAADFKAWPAQGPPTSPSKPVYTRPAIKFEGSTEARDSFKPYEMDRRAPISPPDNRRPALPFEGTTTARDEFREWPLPQKEVVVPPGYRQRPDDRDFGTETRGEFTPKHVDRCPASYLPAPPPSSVNPDAWVDGHVMYDRRHGAWAGGR